MLRKHLRFTVLALFVVLLAALLGLPTYRVNQDKTSHQPELRVEFILTTFDAFNALKGLDSTVSQGILIPVYLLLISSDGAPDLYYEQGDPRPYGYQGAESALIDYYYKVAANTEFLTSSLADKYSLTFAVDNDFTLSAKDLQRRLDGMVSADFSFGQIIFGWPNSAVGQAAALQPELKEDNPALVGEEDLQNPNPCCRAVHVISVNGINSSVDAPFHDWAKDFASCTDGNRNHSRIDFCWGFGDGCFCNPSDGSKQIDKEIKKIKAKYAKDCPPIIVLIGHSLGAIAAALVGEAVDCVFFLDPMPSCGTGGDFDWFCPSTRSLKKVCKEGLLNGDEIDRFRFPEDGQWPVHTPWGESVCNTQPLNQLLPVEAAIEACVNAKGGCRNCNVEGSGLELDCIQAP